jgi:hypothetical protein
LRSGFKTFRPPFQRHYPPFTPLPFFPPTRFKAFKNTSNRFHPTPFLRKYLYPFTNANKRLKYTSFQDAVAILPYYPHGASITKKILNMETKNYVRLCGYVVQDLSSKQYPMGHRVALRIATPEGAESSIPNDHINWHHVIAWDDLADQALAEFGKGSKIEVEGRLAYRIYTGDDGLRKLYVFVKAHLLNHPEK